MGKIISKKKIGILKKKTIKEYKAILVDIFKNRIKEESTHHPV